MKGLLPQKLWNLLSPAGKRQVIQRRDCYPTFTNACKALTDKVGAKNIGDYLEFGVWEGNTLICMFQALTDLKLTHVRLFGFDSFEGYPAIAAIDIENELQPGECASSLSLATERLTENGIDWNRTFLIKGWFSDTLNDTVIQNYNIQKASIIMIDCDLYSSAKESLNFCRPLIKDISVIFFEIGTKRNASENEGRSKNF